MDFARQQFLAESLQAVVKVYDDGRLSPEQAQAIDSILVKIARIVCGDPDWPNHWEEIAQYAQDRSRR